jgi:hypothetical protein
VPNVNYAQNEIKLKQKLQDSKDKFISYSQGNYVTEDFVFPKVFYMFNETNMGLKKYRERLGVKSGNKFQGEMIWMQNKRTSQRTTGEPQRFY